MEKIFRFHKTSSFFLRPASILNAYVLLALLSRKPHKVSGGMCWSEMDSEGTCKRLLAGSVSREECCATSTSTVSTAWSHEELSEGDLFFWTVLSGGVPCVPCKENCEGVKCGAERKCVVKNHHAECVCSPKCKLKSKRQPVCGSDGRTYSSGCRLRKRACKKNNHSLVVDYQGRCRNSCNGVKCSSGKYCVEDQNANPHCVKCSNFCQHRRATPQAHRRVCGSDGVTYPSLCKLRLAACHKGKSIPIAYKGKCRTNATCSNVRCMDGQKCLVEPSSQKPRCVTCQKCSSDPRRLVKDLGGPLCASNNQTYSEWCHMMSDSCHLGIVLETVHSGSCSNDSESNLKIKIELNSPSPPSPNNYYIS